MTGLLRRAGRFSEAHRGPPCAGPERVARVLAGGSGVRISRKREDLPCTARHASEVMRLVWGLSLDGARFSEHAPTGRPSSCQPSVLPLIADSAGPVLGEAVSPLTVATLSVVPGGVAARGLSSRKRKRCVFLEGSFCAPSRIGGGVSTRIVRESDRTGVLSRCGGGTRKPTAARSRKVWLVCWHAGNEDKESTVDSLRATC